MRQFYCKWKRVKESKSTLIEHSTHNSRKPFFFFKYPENIDQDRPYPRPQDKVNKLNTYLTEDLYLVYIKNSQNSTVEEQRIQLEHGQRYEETFHQRRYTDSR